MKSSTMYMYMRMLYEIVQIRRITRKCYICIIVLAFVNSFSLKQSSLAYNSATNKSFFSNGLEPEIEKLILDTVIYKTVTSVWEIPSINKYNY